MGDQTYAQYGFATGYLRVTTDGLHLSRQSASLNTGYPPSHPFLAQKQAVAAT